MPKLNTDVIHFNIKTNGKNIKTKGAQTEQVPNQWSIRNVGQTILNSKDANIEKYAENWNYEEFKINKIENE